MLLQALPRTLFIGVPVLIVCCVSYSVDADDEEIADVDACVQPLSRGQVTLLSPTLADEDRLRRVELKLEAVVDLLEGRQSLPETARFFEYLAALSPETSLNLRRFAGESESDFKRAVMQVVVFARSYCAKTPQFGAAALRGIEAEAFAILGAPVPVR